ncbi:MAG TPA: D-aminoacyl-tRNA deacylase [Candidatus Nitrosocosmicus sp.]
MILLINNFTIITSINDPASKNMQDYLIEDEGFIDNKNNLEIPHNKNNLHLDYKKYESTNYPNISLIMTNLNLLFINNLDEFIPNNNMIIFLSRHVSKSKMPTLTSHSTGNFSDNNTTGGKPMEIGNTYPTFQKQYMKNLYDEREKCLGYDLKIEATHHGPTTSDNPMLFIEIGSSENEWKNRFIASIVCRCLLDTIKKMKDINYDTNIGLGIGGNHYPQKFNDLILHSNVAFGPIISKYNLSDITTKSIEQSLSKSIEKIHQIYIDEKGLGKQKEKILNLIKHTEIEIVYI